MNLDTALFYQNIRFEGAMAISFGRSFWTEILADMSYDSRFMFYVAERFGDNRFISRNEGEWSLPWPSKMIPDFVMPTYDPNFSLSFSDVMDRRALEIKARIHKGEKFVVLFSGGMDSTAIMTALIKNLNKEEQQSVAVNASVHSLLENYDFYTRFIHNKFTVFDSVTQRYDRLITDGWQPITGDEGDAIFGTHLGLQLYHSYNSLIKDFSPEVRSNLLAIRDKISDGDVHYSRYREIIIKFLQGKNDYKFGSLLYSKYVHNINTQNIPVNSLHDFFWWLIFNVKYLHCSVRCSMFYNNTIPVRESLDKSVNWFNGHEIQQWSMVNNNNGTKIRNTIKSYKHTQRQYIYELTKNDWQFHFKTKLESLNNLVAHSQEHPIGLDENYNKIYRLTADKSYYEHHLSNYKIDWPMY
jgi:hypothetical protein